MSHAWMPLYVADMELRAKKLRTLEGFDGPYDAWLDSIGRPF